MKHVQSLFMYSLSETDSEIKKQRFVKPPARRTAVMTSPALFWVRERRAVLQHKTNVFI